MVPNITLGGPATVIEKSAPIVVKQFGEAQKSVATNSFHKHLSALVTLELPKISLRRVGIHPGQPLVRDREAVFHERAFCFLAYNL